MEGRAGQHVLLTQEARASPAVCSLLLPPTENSADSPRSTLLSGQGKCMDDFLPSLLGFC